MQIIACSRIASIFFQSTEGAQVQRLSAIKMFQHSSVYRHQPPRSRTQATVPNHSDLAAWPHMKRGASIINTSRQGRKTGLSYWLYEVVLGLEGPLRPLHSNLDPVTALVWRDCKVRCLPPCMTPFSKLFSLPPQHS
ncbi:hypothetical protein Vretifemale_17189 [Volvox reticuliferus]|uniref:Uncharacterized protein n=1 Tax=Volvox reticuliferus TaxID=1737510 RepID=A0A8J4CZ77_9CHLO|nr:hypothetical protein Vretifemale_17189 [Volvox reticuliferus]GIL89415.1 hypothetical protein Vretifemale_17189 [Volvox reticuliferus]